MPHDAAAGRSERESHRDLALARGRARQHQVRKIRAGDQQDEPRRREEQPERRFEIGSHVGYAGRRWKCSEPEPQIRLLVFGAIVRQRVAEQAGGDRFEVRRRADTRPAGLESAHRSKKPVIPPVEIARSNRVRFGTQRYGDVEGTSHFHAEKLGRGDADDLVRMTIERQRSTESRRAAAVLLLPEAVADHGGRRPAPAAVIGRGQQPADPRMHVQRSEEVAAHPEAGRPAADAAGG